MDIPLHLLSELFYHLLEFCVSCIPSSGLFVDLGCEIAISAGFVESITAYHTPLALSSAYLLAWSSSSWEACPSGGAAVSTVAVVFPADIVAAVGVACCLHSDRQ
jgi:hypothetical protein